jgi:hypothetical protein
MSDCANHTIDRLRARLASVEVVIAAAKEWRALDESEPIGSAAPNAALKQLAFAIDSLFERD